MGVHGKARPLARPREAGRQVDAPRPDLIEDRLDAGLGQFPRHDPSGANFIARRVDGVLGNERAGKRNGFFGVFRQAHAPQPLIISPPRDR
jgi:hypothetical protein